MKTTIKKSVLGGVATLSMMTMLVPQMAFANTSGKTMEGEGIEINAANFPDDDFRSYVSYAIDKDANGWLSEEEAGIQELSITDYIGGFRDITGIEHFTELEKLALNSYYGTELELKSNPKLKEVYLGNCYNMNSLEIEGTSFSKISLINCWDLATLDLKTPELGFLMIDSCYALETLDLSECTKLEYLGVRASLTALDLPEMEPSESGRMFFIDGIHKAEAANTTVNLKEMNPSIDLTKIKSLHNATIDENGNLTVNAGVLEGAGYVYDCGNGYSMDVSFYVDGLAQKGKSWHYFSRGEYTMYSGLATNEYGTWVVKYGAVDFSYNGSYEYEGEVYYITNGYVDTTVTGVGLYRGDWVYYKDGKLDTSYTGLASNWYGWWYIEDGYVDFAYTGLAENEYGTWYVKDGAVQFGTTGFMEISGVVYYITNGYVDTTVTGVGLYNGDWWYVNQGIVDTTFDGIASNWYGTWYIQDGKVDFSFTGIVEFEGVEYQVVAGKVMK